MPNSANALTQIESARHARLARWTGLQIAKRPSPGQRTSAIAAIVSSHTAKHPEWLADWRHNLWKSLSICDERNWQVVYSLENPIGIWVKAFADRLNIPTIELQSHTPSQKPTSGRYDAAWHLILNEEYCKAVNSDFAKLPLIDRAIVSLSDHLFAIELRKESKTERLIHAWLEETSNEPKEHELYVAQTRQSIKSSVVTSGLAKSLKFSRKSINHQIECLGPASNSISRACQLRNFSQGSSDTHALIIHKRIYQASSLATEEFLVHCTRGRTGRYPLQSESSYAAELLLEEDDITSCPFETLRQILIGRRIVATTFLKPDAMASVSFSNVPLIELLTRRQYQSHLQRWDWEPYGIAIRKRKLIDLFGAESVTYSDSSKAIMDIPRWLQQVSSSSSGRKQWSDEREWRTPVDVRLCLIDATDAFVFVPTMTEAQHLSHISPFPIVINGDKVIKS